MRVDFVRHGDGGHDFSVALRTGPSRPTSATLAVPSRARPPQTKLNRVAALNASACCSNTQHKQLKPIETLPMNSARPDCDAISKQEACNYLYKITMSPQSGKKVNNCQQENRRTRTTPATATANCSLLLLVAVLAIQLPTLCKTSSLVQQQQHHLLRQQPPHEAAQQQHLVKQQSECSRNPCQNGAVCVNRADGSYTCLCTAGWQGPNCTENVDDCSMAACENNAKCHDRVGGFVCECPPGKTGLLCQLDDGCYSNPCNVNATCDASPVDGHAICTCPPGFSGLDCMIDEDECQHGAPCEHGGTCVNEPGTFSCVCAKGFSGPRCEINIDECAENPCVNSGTCLDERGGFRCVCQPGFAGERCEINIDDCATNPCENNAICKDEVNNFKCLCQSGFWGQRCEFDRSTPRQHAAGNEPDPGAEPPMPPGNPWTKCARPRYCWSLFHDNICHEDCNTPECLYDGWDCFPTNFNSTRPSFPSLSPPVKTSVAKTCDDSKDSYCLKNYANGICDEECNTQECSWDGLDCEIDATFPHSTQAQGLLVIRVEPPIEFDKNNDQKIELAGLIRKVSHATKTVLRVERFNQVEGGTEIELIADTRKCQSSCYNSTAMIAKFLEALKFKGGERLTDQLQSGALKISGVSNKQDTPPAESASATTIWVVFCATIATVCTVLMVVSIGTKNRVKEKAVVWFPEGFKPVLSSRKRDPTDRKASNGASGGGRGISTLQALGGNFFRGIKRNERNISTDPNGLHSTDIDRCTATPNGIYHEPYDQYDQYGSTYTATDAGTIMNNVDHEPMTPPTMPSNPINIEGPHGLTPLMVASMGQPFSTKEPLGLVAYGTTGEMLESAENNITDLLNRGAQLNLANKVTGETALHLAARHGRVDAARGLLERCDSQDVNAKDATGRTPLHTAIAADSSGVFELLIRCRGTDLNAQTNDGTTPLILATRVGTYSMLEELILNECEVTKSDSNGKTALHWAAATNNVDAIRRLLAVRETNKDAQDSAEETPLFLAAREGAKGAVEILLSHNANKDLCDQMDRSPIEIARSRQHYDIVRLLDDHAPSTPSARSLKGGFVSTPTPLSASSRCDVADQKPLSHGGRNAERRAMLKSVPNYNSEEFGCLSNNSKSEPEISASLPRRITAPHAQVRETKTKLGATTELSNFETHCRSISSMHHSTSRQISPFSPVSDSNNNTNGPITVTQQQPPPPSYHAHSQSGLAEVYNVPCLKNYLTPSPDSPFSLDSMASPPGAYTHQQYQNLHASHHILTTQEQAGVFI